MKLKYLGSGFYWQNISVDKQGGIWEGWFDSFTKRTKYVKTNRKVKK